MSLTKLLWTEVSPYRIENYLTLSKVSKDKPLLVVGEKETLFTLFVKGHPTFEILSQDVAKYPIKKINVSQNSFFYAFGTQMADCSKVTYKGVAETLLISPEGVITPKWKIYDYVRDPYKDTYERGKFKIFSHLPTNEEDFVVSEDGFHIDVIMEELFGQSVRVTYSSDYYPAVFTRLNNTELMLVKTSYLEKLL